jgi:hypothetical protein
MSPGKKVLSFVTPSDQEATVGRVHRDGSITFRGRTYPTVKDVPPECQALRTDVEAYAQWRRLYRAVAPQSRQGR